jgi:SAM-dependent methyltransferase
VTEWGTVGPNLEERLDLLAEQAPRYNDWLYGRCAPHVGTRVLDFGAGTGTFTEILARDGRSVVAYEPHPDHASLLRERFAGTGQVEVVEELAEGEFDSTICINVIEHVEDDVKALERIHELSAPGARLLVLTPAHPALYGAYDTATGHVRRYRKDELAAKLREAGFTVRELRHVNPVGALGWFVSGRVLRRPYLGEGSLGLYDRFVPVFKLIDRLHLPFGLSLWAVAVKSSNQQ